MTRKIGITDKEKALRASVGAKFASIRSGSQLTQKQVAETLGCTVNHISDIETGQSAPTLSEIVVFCETCRITVNQLFYDNDSAMVLDDQMSNIWKDLSEKEKAGIIKIANTLHEINT